MLFVLQVLQPTGSWKGLTELWFPEAGCPLWEAGGAVLLCQGAVLTCSPRTLGPAVLEHWGIITPGLL